MKDDIAPPQDPQTSASFSRGTMLGGLATGLLAVTAGGLIPSKALGDGITDVDILNFALNLEYLEAEFYSYATTGHGIEGMAPTDGRGKRGPTTGGKRVALNNDFFTADIAEEIAHDELEHVILLHGALGSYAVSKPDIKLDALGVGFGSIAEFLLLARAFEDTGVSAYAGAAPLIQSKAYLGVAARILGTEAEHSGNIRLQVALRGVRTMPLDNRDVVPPPSGTQFISVNAQALVAARTVQEVLAIVRPFFPDGLNGAIR
jgi:hypothetical protein